MKPCSNKNHLLMSCKEATHENIDGSMIKSSQRETLQDINLDIELKFEDRVNLMYKGLSQKLYGLAIIVAFMDLEQWTNIMKAFAESQFGYCSLMWRFHSRRPNNKINRIHERALRIKDKYL